MNRRNFLAAIGEAVILICGTLHGGHFLAAI